MVRTLWVTNDYPPRPGGIEAFVSALLGALDPRETRVLASDFPGAGSHDAAVRYQVDRVGRWPLLPGPRLRARVRAAVAEHDPAVIVFGAAWPLAELAAGLGRPTLALTHGHEAGLTSVGLGGLVQHATRDLSACTTISAFTEATLRSVTCGTTVFRLPPGVDTNRFRPGVDGSGFRCRHGIAGDEPLVVTVGRLVRRKGHDVLVRAWPKVQAHVPGARLLVAGDGPLRSRLRWMVRRLGLEPAVTFTGSLPAAELPVCYATADVFAMPCRTRLGGLDVEGLGMVFLEAQAAGTPVVAGRSGGAPETLLDGRTGTVVDGRSPTAVGAAVADLLADRGRRTQAGQAARAFVEARYAWPAITDRFARLLEVLAVR